MTEDRETLVLLAENGTIGRVLTVAPNEEDGLGRKKLGKENRELERELPPRKNPGGVMVHDPPMVVQVFAPGPVMSPHLPPTHPL